MATRLALATRNALGNTLITQIAGGAILRIYSGPQPTGGVASPVQGTQLAQLTCATPFAPAPTTGVVQASAITGDVAADATGQAGWFRLFQSNGTTAIIDGQVTVSGGGGELQLNSLQITQGQPVNVSSFNINVGS